MKCCDKGSIWISIIAPDATYIPNRVSSAKRSQFPPQLPKNGIPINHVMSYMNIVMTFNCLGGGSGDIASFADAVDPRMRPSTYVPPLPRALR